MNSIRIATRKSPLALEQAKLIKQKLLETHSGISVELVEITTKGDLILDKPLQAIGGKGLFIKELELALLEDRADIAVHSVKDLPYQLADGFCLPVIAYREDPRDVLVTDLCTSFEDLPIGARVGSTSLRRKAQLLGKRPDLEFVPIRGNVGTRIGKLDAGDCAAVVLAYAGLHRLNLLGRNFVSLSTDLCLPAAGQGALGVECLSGSQVIDLLEPLSDPVVETAVLSERYLVESLQADCSSPVGAYAFQQEDGQIRLTGLVGSETGDKLIRSSAVAKTPREVADEVFAELCSMGSRDLLGH